MSVFSLFSVLVFLIFFRGSGGGRRTEKFGDGKTEISCEFTRFNISKQDHAKSAFVARAVFMLHIRNKINQWINKNGNPLLSGCAILRCIQYRDLLCHNTVWLRYRDFFFFSWLFYKLSENGWFDVNNFEDGRYWYFCLNSRKTYVRCVKSEPWRKFRELRWGLRFRRNTVSKHPNGKRVTGGRVSRELPTAFSPARSAKTELFSSVARLAAARLRANLTFPQDCHFTLIKKKKGQ